MEEYFHASNLLPFLGDTVRDSRLDRGLPPTLELFDRFKIKATFFILGEVALSQPEAIRSIAQAGHEIAAHSFSHRCIYDLSEAEFREEARKVKDLLEQQTGQEVLGFRAPNFSINAKCPWAHAVLAELGYRYDSSVYPVHHPRYSNPLQSREVKTIETSGGPLKIVPLATFPLKLPLMSRPLNLPLAGGAYWRLLPSTLLKSGLHSINKRENKPFFCYFHPWELDAAQPQLTSKYSLAGWRHYHNLSSYQKILASYFQAFQFSSYASVLNLDAQ